MWSYLLIGYLLTVAERFAPVAECGLFWLAYGDRAERFRRGMGRDLAAIVAANLASFAVGEALFWRAIANHRAQVPGRNG